MTEKERVPVNSLRFRDFASRWIGLRILFDWLLELSRMGLAIAIPLQIGALTNLFVMGEVPDSGEVTIAAIKLLLLAISLQLVILFLKLHELRLFTDLLRCTTVFMFESVFGQSPEFFSKFETQTLNVRLLEETPNVVDHWLDSFIKLPIAILSIAAFGVIMFRENQSLAALMIPLSIAGGFTYLSNQKLREKSRNMRNGWENLRSTADEMVENFVELRANDASAYGLKIIKDAYERHCDRYLMLKRSETWTLAVPKLVSAAQLGVLFLVGVQLCSEGSWLNRFGGNCDWGTVVGFLFFLKLFQKPVESVMRYSIVRQRRLESLQAIDLLLQETSGDQRRNSQSSGEDRPSINVCDVTVTSNTDAKILDGVSLRIEPGEKVAITGTSGSGKSTLIRTIAGILRPSSGSVQFGDPDQGDTTCNLPNSLTYLPQRPVLFSWSIRDNILLGLRRPNEEEEEELQDLDLRLYPEIRGVRALDKLLLKVADTVGLTHDLFARGLDRPLSLRFFEATEIAFPEVKRKTLERLRSQNIQVDFETSGENSLRSELLGGRPRFGNSEFGVLPKI